MRYYRVTGVQRCALPFLFDGRGHDARHTDTVAAHVERGLAARLIEHQRLHGLAVLAAQLEDVTDLDAARDLQPSCAGRAGVALDDVAQIRGAGEIGRASCRERV